jgi:hypothetical protein
MEQVWITKEMPIEWEEGTVCPIHKKGDQLECGNYRGINYPIIDFKAAYDSVKRDKLLKAIEELLIPQKLINLTKATLRNIKCRVRIQNQLSELFTTERGLRQGDALGGFMDLLWKFGTTHYHSLRVYPHYSYSHLSSNS